MLLARGRSFAAFGVLILVGSGPVLVACGEEFSGAGGDAGAAAGGGAGATSAGGQTTSTTTPSSAGGGTTTPPNDGGVGGDVGGSGGGGTWPDPVALATGQAGPWGITVDPSNLYWANEANGTIAAMPAHGGAILVVASMGGHPHGIADWAGYIAWADPQTDQGCRCNATGCQPGCSGTTGGDPEDIALSVAQTAYFTAPGVGSVLSWNGSLAAEVAAGQANPQGIDTGALHVYWANAGANQIMRVLMSGGAPEEFATASGPPQHLVVGQSAVYWSVPTQGIVEGRTFQNQPVTVSDAEGQPWDITADDVRIYWTDRARGMVRCARPDGSEVVTIASGLADPIGITVSASAVYWTEHTAGTIWKADKPR